AGGLRERRRARRGGGGGGDVAEPVLELEDEPLRGLGADALDARQPLRVAGADARRERLGRLVREQRERQRRPDAADADQRPEHPTLAVGVEAEEARPRLRLVPVHEEPDAAARRQRLEALARDRRGARDAAALDARLARRLADQFA